MYDKKNDAFAHAGLILVRVHLSRFRLVGIYLICLQQVTNPRFLAYTFLSYSKEVLTQKGPNICPLVGQRPDQRSVGQKARRPFGSPPMIRVQILSFSQPIVISEPCAELA